MAVIKIRIKCPVCRFETTLKTSDSDSRGFFEVPDRYCNKCKILLTQVVDNVGKEPGGK